MLAELVFVTRLLGLMSSTHDIHVQVDPSVQAVEIMLDGKRAYLLRGAPWRAKIDFGPEIAPHELIAVAYDAQGVEIARDIQYVNLPRSHAEIGVMFKRNLADITWQHIADLEPRKMKVTLNGKVLASKVTSSVALPPLPPSDLHVLSVDLEFKDGAHVHRDIVFGGFSEEVPAELTATIVRQRDAGRTDQTACFQRGPRAIPASAVEKGEAAILFVRAGTPPAELRSPVVIRGMAETPFVIPDASLRFVWPLASGKGTTELFSRSDHLPGIRGVRWTISRLSGPLTQQPRFADAVAVAGTEALREPRRRAVVLILAGEEDSSRYEPAVVRRYLERIGVPLHVWTAKPRKTDPRWGQTHDISNARKLAAAVEALRQDLDRQRVAWLPVTAYDALHVATAPDCAWEPLARHSP